jgi:hypothetical protein
MNHLTHASDGKSNHHGPAGISRCGLKRDYIKSAAVESAPTECGQRQSPSLIGVMIRDQS